MNKILIRSSELNHDAELRLGTDPTLQAAAPYDKTYLMFPENNSNTEGIFLKYVAKSTDPSLTPEAQFELQEDIQKLAKSGFRYDWRLEQHLGSEYSAIDVDAN